jgi:hypothetical protein
MGGKPIARSVAPQQEATSQGDAMASIESAFRMEMASGTIASQESLRILQGLEWKHLPELLRTEPDGVDLRPRRGSP